MNALPSIDQKILASSPFISSVPDYSICFLIKIQGICENVFENNPQDTTTSCKIISRINFYAQFSVNTYFLEGFHGILKAEQKYSHIYQSYKLCI